jgi:hypothetical protein
LHPLTGGRGYSPTTPQPAMTTCSDFWTSRPANRRDERCACTRGTRS